MMLRKSKVVHFSVFLTDFQNDLPRILPKISNPNRIPNPNPNPIYGQKLPKLNFLAHFSGRRVSPAILDHRGVSRLPRLAPKCQFFFWRFVAFGWQNFLFRCEMGHPDCAIGMPVVACFPPGIIYEGKKIEKF